MPATASRRSACTATRISSVTLCFLRTVTTPCPAPGTRPSVCGTWPSASRPAASNTIPRTFCRLRSPWTIVRSCPARATGPSSCGIRSPSARTPSRRTVTPTGCHSNLIKVWNLANCKLKIDHLGHNGYLNSVLPDGFLCTSGTPLWDLNDDIYLHSLEHNDVINALCFSPNRYWLCFTYGPSIKIWDLACKTMVEELKPSNAFLPQCLSLSRSTDGQTLYAGYSDNIICVWQVSVSAR